MKTCSISLLLTTLALLAGAVTTRSQVFSIDWQSIDGGGGGVSAGGPYSLSGTIGQPDAGPQSLTGGSYSLTGGFWSLFAIPTAGAPRLNIRANPQASTVTISWPSTTAGFTLQQNTDPGRSNWTAVPQTVSDNGTNKFLIVSPPTGHRFYRLFKP